MTPLLLLPGLLNDGDLWRDQVASLSDVASCTIGDITRGDTLEEVARQVMAEAPPRFALAGFSLGGYVAQEILRIAPERVTRVALLDTSFKADDPDRSATRRVLERSARAPGRFNGFGDRLLATYLHPDNLSQKAIVERIRGMTQRLGPDVFVRQNNIERRDGVDVLRGLTRPVLVLCGEADALTPPDLHRQMAALVPDSELVVVPGSGHMTPIEAPDAVSAAMRRWLMERERRTDCEV